MQPGKSFYYSQFLHITAFFEAKLTQQKLLYQPVWAWRSKNHDPDICLALSSESCFTYFLTLFCNRNAVNVL